MPRVAPRRLAGKESAQAFAEAKKKPWQITARVKRVARMGSPGRRPLIGGRTDIALGYSATLVDLQYH